MAESGKVDFGKLLDSFWKTTQEVLGEIAYREGSKIEGVREAVNTQAVIQGKNLLWKIFPIIAIGGVLLFTIGKFK